MQRITIQAVQGGIRVVTGGQTSTPIVEGSFPSCTVSVFNTGTLVLATLFGDNLSPPTPKSNPFTADSSGFAFFYAANGSRVDVQLSGTGITVPFLVASDILVDDGTLLTTIAPQTVAFSATPTFDLSQASWFKMTLTGNVTTPAFTNPQSGSLLLLSLTQNAAGGNTFAWPAAFLHPPTIASAANAVTELVFKYDGVNWRSVAATGDNLQIPTNANITGILVVQGASTLASLTVTANALVGGTLGVTGAVTLTVPLTGTSGGTGISSTATFPASGVIDTGTGTTNRVPKFTTGASGIIGNSSITDDGTKVSSSEPFTLTPQKQIFTSNGTFTIPTGVTAVKVLVLGAGGAGGGATTTAVSGGGGNSGAPATKWLTGLTPGNTIAVTVGTGGTGVPNNTGNNGGNSTIASGTQVITTVTGVGGAGGNLGGNAQPAASTSTNGDINGTTSFGSIASFTNSGGVGGASIMGGGGQYGTAAAGSAGVSPGAGGGGAGGTAGGAVAGGAGANGIVIFEWVS